MKKCPFCQEEIQDTATKCRYCGEWLDKKEEPTGSSPQQSKITADFIKKPTEIAMIYAGFWKRFAAFLIDIIILSIGAFAIGFVFGLILFAGGTYDKAALAWQGFFCGAIIHWLYFSVMESSSTQATLGKMALGIKVTDLNGNKIAFGKATGRYFGKFISSIILGIGFIMVAFTQKKQGLHDIMAGCLVVNRDLEPTGFGDAAIGNIIHESGERSAEKVRNGNAKWTIPIIFIGIVFIVIAIVATYFYYKEKTGLNEVALTEAPEPPQVLTAADWFNKAIALSDGHKFSDPPKAIEYLNNAIKLQPNYADAYGSLGDAYADIGLYQRAIDNYNEVIRLQPNNALYAAVAYLHRGFAYHDLGQSQRAVEDYNEFMRFQPNDAMAFLHRGIAYQELGQRQRSMADYNEAIRLQPNDAKAYNLRGAAYLMQGNNKLGCSDAQKACELGECTLFKLSKRKGNCR